MRPISLYVPLGLCSALALLRRWDDLERRWLGAAHHPLEAFSPSHHEHGTNTLGLRDKLNIDISPILQRMSCIPGRNSQVDNGAVWLGNDGRWTNTFINNASQDLVLVIWGNAGSWVNAVQPYITVHLSVGSSRTVSFADDQSGGWAGVYEDTLAVNGQISNTWGEFTFGPYATVDVSREPNMKGHGMTIVTPTCVSDMDTCVFICDHADTCTHDYSLHNCANGSQEGATYANYKGTDTGGCSNMGSAAALQTYLY